MNPEYSKYVKIWQKLRKIGTFWVQWGGKYQHTRHLVSVQVKDTFFKKKHKMRILQFLNIKRIEFYGLFYASAHLKNVRTL